MVAATKKPSKRIPILIIRSSSGEVVTPSKKRERSGQDSSVETGFFFGCRAARKAARARAGYNSCNQARNKLLSTSPHVVTRLLVDWGKGDQRALDKLTPLVYQELKRLAAGYLRRERREHTLQSTAVVHEAWLRLVDQRQVRWQNRAQFFALAAEMIRRILIDHARS